MGPFIQSKEKISKTMLHVLIALLPIILFNVYKNGYIPYSHHLVNLFGLFYPLLFVLIGAFTSFLIETIYYLIRKQKQNILSSYSFYPGLFLSLLLPINTPIYVLIIGSILASIFGKLVFGGFGRNILNPALTGYILIILIFGSTLGSYHNPYELDTISKATPLTNATLVSGIGTYEQLVSPYGGFVNFLLGFIPGGLGEVSSLLCIVAFVYLTITKTIKWRIPVFYVGTVFLLTTIIGRMLGAGFYYPLFHILSGGLLFGSVFMATDPVTSTVTPIGQILQGIFLGILTVILRFTLTEGVAISILIMNIFVFLLDKIGSKARFNFSKAIIPFVIAAFLIMGTGIIIAWVNHSDGSKDPNFEIVSKQKNGSKITYEATQKGYGGKIKGKIVIENNQVISFEIIDHNETQDRYQVVMDKNYIDTLLSSQNDLESVDAVSSATVTSTAIKKMLINVLEDYS